MRSVFLIYPHSGGTFTVYRAMRKALAPLGIDLRWLGYSHVPDLTRLDPAYVMTQDLGDLLNAKGMTEAQICRDMARAIEEGGYEQVFVNVLTSVPEMSAVAYLPPSIRRVMIVHNITPGTYSAACAVRPYVDATVGVSPRIQQTLTGRYRFPADRTFCVPNGMDFSSFTTVNRQATSRELRLLFLGRLVDADKGVFWLPEILQQLSDLPVYLSIAGAGGDLEELKKRCQALGDRVRFLGLVAPEKVPELASNHDVFLMPSRFEGLPYTLIECMATGCIPVASSISGVTDFVVADEKTGLLFPIGNVRAAAQAIRKLFADPDLRQKLSSQAIADVRARFSVETVTEAYRPVLASLERFKSEVVPLTDPDYNVLRVGGGWRRLLPRRIKNVLRNYLNR